MDNPLDQYFMRHPEAFFGKNFENALVNPANQYILRAHLICAAWEGALTPSDDKYFGATFAQEVKELEKQGVLKLRRGRWFLSPSIAYPAQDTGIRGVSGERYLVWDTETNALLETVEADVAFFQIYPGAIYLHQGETYLIKELDLKTRTAYAQPVTVPYYTETKELTDIRILREIQNKKLGDHHRLRL
jgi:DEAD/DEAH box helicase domain-containing protein